MFHTFENFCIFHVHSQPQIYFFQLIVWTKLNEGLQPSYMECLLEMSFNLPPPFQLLTCPSTSPACQQKDTISKDWIKLKYILKTSIIQWIDHRTPSVKATNDWLTVYWPLRFTVVFTTASHLTVCEPDESSPWHFILFFNIHFNVMLSSVPSSFLQVSMQNPVCISLLPIHAPPISSSLIYLITQVIAEYKSWSSPLWIFLQSPQN
jgi:hypothetical protein